MKLVLIKILVSKVHWPSQAVEDKFKLESSALDQKVVAKKVFQLCLQEFQASIAGFKPPQAFQFRRTPRKANKTTKIFCILEITSVIYIKLQVLSDLK